MSEVIESTVNAEQEEVVNPQTEQTTESVTEEVATPAVEEKPVQSPEDNAKFAEVRRKAEAEARDKTIADLYGESHGITTWAQYQEALKEQEIRAQYESKELPKEVVDELVESRKFRETYQSEQEVNAKKAWEDKEYKLFLDTYKDVKPEDIPASVWVEFNEGKSLVDAFAKHENTLLKNKLAEYEKGKVATTANQVNAETSPGSVTGLGSVKDTTLTPESIEAMTPQELMKRWGEVKQVMKMK